MSQGDNQKSIGVSNSAAQAPRSPESDEDTFLRLARLRRDLFGAIGRQLATDSHCKSYEGTFEIHLPSYFEELPGTVPYTSPCAIMLHCYVIGPNRHYEWRGGTLASAMDACERDVRAWIEENDAAIADEARHG